MNAAVSLRLDIYDPIAAATFDGVCSTKCTKSPCNVGDIGARALSARPRGSSSPKRKVKLKAKVKLNPKMKSRSCRKHIYISDEVRIIIVVYYASHLHACCCNL
jgi:hypothetical protein